MTNNQKYCRLWYASECSSKSKVTVSKLKSAKQAFVKLSECLKRNQFNQADTGALAWNQGKPIHLCFSLKR